MFYSICKSNITSGSVTIEDRVVKTTTRDANMESLSYSSAKIVVVAAAGMATSRTQTVSSSFGTSSILSAANAPSGISMSRIADM